MRQLLTHTSGLSYEIDANDPVDRAYLEAELWVSEDIDTLAAKVGRLPLRSQPGTEWRYSVGMDLAGLVVQRLAGQRFDRYLKEHLFEPLDMRDTGFVIPDEKRGVGVLTDPVARGVSGNAGEFYHDGAAGTVF